MKPKVFAHKALGRTTLLASLITISFAAQSASAANLVLKASDAATTSSLTSPLTGAAAGWVTTVGTGTGVAAVAGNNYSIGSGIGVRTPAATASGNTYSFVGDQLSVESGGTVLGKTGNNVFGNSVSATISVPVLILNGGNMFQGGSNSDTSALTVTGTIAVNANSGIGALGAGVNGSASFESLNIASTISGSANLTVAGSINAGANSGVVRLNSANTYSGTITVATPGNGFVASAVNRLLQLNNLNALQSATLNLTSVPNGLSFANGVNNGTYTIGALSGTSNQTLTDTASVPVKVNLGSNNATTTYSGILSGSGSVTKSGSGTLTLSGNNTYTGPTTVNAGTLSLAFPYLKDTATVSIASTAILNLSHSSTDVVGKLVINNTAQPDGVYGAVGSAAPNQTAAITGTGFIQVTTPAAQNVSLTATDPFGGTSFNTDLRWSDASPPSALNNYFTGAFGLRTPSTSGSFTFAGASLTIDPVGGMIGKGAGGSTTQTITISNLILNGGLLYQAQTGSDTAVMNVQGAINVIAASSIGALGAAADNNVNFETLNVAAPISGSAGLTVAGTANSSGNTGVVKLSAANPFTGNITVAQPANIASATDRLLQLNHLDALANATLTLNTTTANGLSFASGVNSGAFNVGALAGTANQSLTDTIGGVITLNVGGSGASTTYSGILSGAGALTKSGAGTLTLAGVNSYTGATNVNAGTLVLTNSYQSIGNLTVADGAGMGVKVATPDAYATTTGITLGTSGPTTLAFDFNGLDTTGGSALLNTGAFTANGSVNVTMANGNFLSAGTHPLIGYTSFSGTALAGTFALGPRSNGTLVNDIANNVLKLNVTADVPKWTGRDNGNWVVGSTGANSNWKLVAANTPTNYLETDVVLFDDSAIGTKNVVISAANVTPASTTFNTDAGYTLGGAFGIAGSGPLVKDGSGTLTITNVNTFTGATTIYAGTLQFGDGITDGSIASTPNIANEGTLVYNRVGSFSYGGVISGNGSLVKSGPGTQTLTAANTYFGTTTVTAGLLKNGINNALRTTTDLTVNGGTYDLAGFDQTVTSLSDGGSSAGTVTNSGALKTLAVGGGDSTFSGEISGALSLKIQGGGKLTLPDSNSYTGTTLVSSGTLSIGNNAAAGTGTLDFGGGTIQSTDSTARTIINPINFSASSSFAGTGNLTFTSTPPANGTDKTLTVDNPQTEFSGVLGGASGRTKEGTGLLIFSGLNNYTKATTVNAGTLRITHAVLADAAPLVIGAAGVLDLPYSGVDQVGSLTINGVVKANGTYSATTDPGFITGTGKIRVGPEVVGYDSWKSSFAFTAGVNDGALNDPDGDGVSNVLEYVLGGIPIGAGAGNPSILPSQTLTATDLILTFKRSDLSEADVVLKVQWSADLATWNDFATVGAVDALPAVDVTEDSPTADIDTVVVTIPRSVTGGGKLFGRLQAVK
ncbi:autotransporter-associated beta strand repeat-containing protein [Luteolibacter sp.]|uniref:beta strand repeat-containing protein n=1 Tax=Luteolibacter sp. TaxID=1962973 RepID=UPI003263639F